MRAKAEELRSTLLSSVSHDLRTPLAAITGMATSLRDRAETRPAAEREALDTIVEEARRLSRILTNLLSITKVESGAEPRRERVPLEEIVGSALARLEQRSPIIRSPSRFRGLARPRRSDPRRATAAQPARERREAHTVGHADRRSHRARAGPRGARDRRPRARRAGGRARVRQVRARPHRCARRGARARRVPRHRGRTSRRHRRRGARGRRRELRRMVSR